MNTMLFSMCAILLGLNITAFAKYGSTINGSSYLSKGEYDSLKINGNLTFKDLFVKDSIVINGSARGQKLKCHTIKSNGSIDVDGLQVQDVESNGSFSGKNIDIAGDAEFNGRVEIKNGKLHDIQIISTKSTFLKTQVIGDIFIKKIVKRSWLFFGFLSHEPSTQILELKDHTIVSGNVVFEEDGEVHLFNGAKVEGQIIKARVIKK